MIALLIYYSRLGIKHKDNGLWQNSFMSSLGRQHRITHLTIKKKE